MRSVQGFKQVSNLFDVNDCVIIGTEGHADR
jgi:hypothetical protein